MRKRKASDRDKRRRDEAVPHGGNESHRTSPGMEEQRAERTRGAGSHGDAHAGDEGIDQPGGPLPNEFPDEEELRKADY
jgi:hypothetical protein